MTRFVRRPLAIALSAVLGLAVIAPVAHAQDPTSTTRTKSMREQRAERMAELGKDKEATKQAEPKPALYPNATRVPPEAKASGKMVKNLQDLQAVYEKQDYAGVIAKAEQVAAMPAAGAYEKSFAYSLAGNAAADMDDQAKAAEYFAKAVAANGLDNDSHFNTIYNLAVIQYGNDKYAEALATMDRFLAETRSEKPEHQGMRAAILANLDRNDEAAAIYKDLVAKNPNDKRVLMNAVAALQGADKFDEANTLLEDAYKRGMLTETRELRALYIGYMNAQRWTEAQKVIEDGLAKGVLQPGPDLARDYQVLAQNAYVDDKVALAIDLYSKAAPMAADGEAYLNLAKVLEYSGKKADAKVAAQKALDKGVKKPDEAKSILSR
jgi:tetratricopeptide (TPR) repeat protein